jgi:hypothetical protein
LRPAHRNCATGAGKHHQERHARCAVVGAGLRPLRCRARADVDQIARTQQAPEVAK